MKLKDEALEYALLYRMEDQWRHVLEDHFGPEKEDVEREYQNLKIWSTEQYELVADEKQYDGPTAVVLEGQVEINEPKTLKYLRDSKQSNAIKNWFKACKEGDVKYVKSHMELTGT